MKGPQGVQLDYLKKVVWVLVVEWFVLGLSRCCCCFDCFIFVCVWLLIGCFGVVTLLLFYFYFYFFVCVCMVIDCLFWGCRVVVVLIVLFCVCVC